MLTKIGKLCIGQNLYFYLNHPIKWIRLVGVVVALDVYPARWIMLLDDSSGATIEVTCARPAPVNSKNGITEPNVPISADGRAAVDGFASKTIGLTATGRTMDLSGIDTGAVVKVKGGLGMFRGQKQVMLERICTTNTPFLSSLSRPPHPFYSPLLVVLFMFSNGTNLYLSNPHHPQPSQAS